jgi:hypothetical protein
MDRDLFDTLSLAVIRGGAHGCERAAHRANAKSDRLETSGSTLRTSTCFAKITIATDFDGPVTESRFRNSVRYKTRQSIAAQSRRQQ